MIGDLININQSLFIVVRGAAEWVAHRTTKIWDII